MKTRLVEDKGGKERVPGATKDKKMRGEVEGLRVLRETDQNIVITQDEQKARKNKRGTWRRIVSLKSKIGISDQSEGSEGVENRRCKNGKRGFRLVDKEKTVRESVQKNKNKNKSGIEGNVHL